MLNILFCWISYRQYLMLEFTIISLGSIIGSILRWKINNLFLANILGCLIFGFVNNLKISKNYKLLICFSFCGSLTSFSTWIFDLFKLINKNAFLIFFYKICLFLIIGYLALYLGELVSRKLFIKK